MIKKINEEKVIMKHLIMIEGIDYPTDDDKLYEIVLALEKLNLLNDEFKASDIINNLNFNSEYKYNSKKLTDDILNLDKKYFSNEEKRGTIYFKLKYHPWE